MALPSDAVPLAPVSRAVPDLPAAARSDPALLQPNVGALLHDVARLMRRRFERRTRQTGLAITRQQARVLLSIARNEGVSQAAIATLLDIEPIALVRMLDRLHEEGFVERHLHPTDRRVRTLWLTPLGWRVVDRVLAINRDTREEACAGLSPAAREAMMRALDHMKVNLLLAAEGESAAAE
ncbi:MAG TPA: MarR family winged helix-turn-helix transcriptional regulator [Stellaceae bacterium]|nr:MarR family winged helix-turn-helix transcriptional regulator [Stellaceae bacterium]